MATRKNNKKGYFNKSESYSMKDFDFSLLSFEKYSHVSQSFFYEIYLLSFYMSSSLIFQDGLWWQDMYSTRTLRSISAINAEREHLDRRNDADIILVRFSNEAKGFGKCTSKSRELVFYFSKFFSTLLLHLFYEFMNIKRRRDFKIMRSKRGVIGRKEQMRWKMRITEIKKVQDKQ